MSRRRTHTVAYRLNDACTLRPFPFSDCRVENDRRIQTSPFGLMRDFLRNTSSSERMERFRALHAVALDGECDTRVLKYFPAFVCNGTQSTQFEYMLRIFFRTRPHPITNGGVATTRWHIHLVVKPIHGSGAKLGDDEAFFKHDATDDVYRITSLCLVEAVIHRLLHTRASEPVERIRAAISLASLGGAIDAETTGNCKLVEQKVPQSALVAEVDHLHSTISDVGGVTSLLMHAKSQCGYQFLGFQVTLVGIHAWYRLQNGDEVMLHTRHRAKTHLGTRISNMGTKKHKWSHSTQKGSLFTAEQLVAKLTFERTRHDPANHDAGEHQQ